MNARLTFAMTLLAISIPACDDDPPQRRAATSEDVAGAPRTDGDSGDAVDALPDSVTDAGEADGQTYDCVRWPDHVGTAVLIGYDFLPSYICGEWEDAATACRIRACRIGCDPWTVHESDCPWAPEGAVIR